MSNVADWTIEGCEACCEEVLSLGLSGLEVCIRVGC